nr:sulfite exporter TauE/SafE family protein [Rubellimicrobium arenae]
MALLVFAASFIRGYSGFGFAALIAAGAALVTDPIELVPVLLLSDMVLTGAQVPTIRGHIAWRRVASLLLGAAVGVPLGLWLFARLSPDAGRLAVSGWVLLMCLGLWAGWRLHRPPGLAANAGVGVLSGLANGAAIGGLPVAVFFAAQPIPAATLRATLVTYFAVLDLWTLGLLAWAGQVTLADLRLLAIGLPLMIAGVLLGSRRFLAAPPEEFRRFAIWTLMALSLLGMVRTLL